jgi:cell division septation protein DedD
MYSPEIADRWVGMTSIFRSRNAKPETVDEELDPAPAPEVRKTEHSKRMALFAFLGVFLAVMVSSVGYLAYRRSSPAVPPKQIASLSPAQMTAPPLVQKSPDPVPAPPSVAVAEAAAKPVNPPPASPPVVAPTPKPAVVAPPPASAEPVAPVVLPGPEWERPQANRTYLQIGSIEKGVAEVLAQGLRIRGLRATVAPGVTPKVYRIIVGPFESVPEMKGVEKMLAGMGFQTFPRQFSADELRRLMQEASATASAPVSPPDVRR